MNESANAFLRTLTHPFKFRMFLFLKIPSAFFSGVRIESADENSCTVGVPYGWFSQNPFRSTYFACLSMAAEMSTGALAMTHVYKRNPPISMLVIKSEAQYFKKAVGKTRFYCEDGEAIKVCIEKAISSGEGQVVRARSIGRNKEGEMVAEFFFTWSFKQKRA
jgi:Domain of unknown function (DUF4442)